jgi:ubiquinone/menaquinone biosynthesis C-methylase UbiE
MMKSVFDRYFSQYEEWFELNKLVYLSELNLLEKVLPKKARGLEIGVGSGRFAAPLKIDVGIDPSRNMLRLAKLRGVEVCLGKGEYLPFKDEAFGYVAIIVTLCFVDDPKLVLNEAKRVLVKGGKLVIGIVDRESPWGKKYLDRKETSVFYKVANFFSAEEVIELSTKLGFKKIKAYQTLFQMPDSFLKIEKPRKGYGEGGFAVITCEK